MRCWWVKGWAHMNMSDPFHTWHVYKLVHRLAFVSLDLNVRCCTDGSIHHVFIFLRMSCNMERMCSEYMSCHWTSSSFPWFPAVNSERLQLSHCNWAWNISLLDKIKSRRNSSQTRQSYSLALKIICCFFSIKKMKGELIFYFVILWNINII